MIRTVRSRARHRLVEWSAGVRARWYARYPGRMRVGVGVGLRFDPGTADRGYVRGDVELPVQDALAGHLRPGDVFYDVGANVGFLTVIGRRLVGPTGHAVAIEPVPTNATLVRRNCAINGFGDVQVVERAVADTCGAGRLVLARHSGGAALSTVDRPADATTAIDVPLTTVDALVAETGLVPTVVKIDVEGAELAVLTGMAETIAEHRPLIVCEIDDGTQVGYDRKYDSCVRHLRTRGYRITPLAASYPDSSWLVGHFVAEPIA